MQRSLSFLVVFLAGLAAGGYLFSKSLPRSFLAASACDDQCLRVKDLAGLLASAGIQHAPELMPFVESKSSSCVGVRHPKPEGRYHMVYLPRRDVRNIMELTPEDVPYLTGCLALAREDIVRAGIRDYRLVSNGPALQQVTYMHFHVIAR
jgi:hypothetical protein